MPATAARSPADVPALPRLLPRPDQLPLPLEGNAAPAPVLTYSIGGPERAATVSIRPEPGGGWRVSYGLAADRPGDDAARARAADHDDGWIVEASAILAPTYPAALAAAQFARALLNGAVRLHVRAVAPAMLEAVRAAHAAQTATTTPPPTACAPSPADDPAPPGRRRVVPFRARGADPLAPTG